MTKAKTKKQRIILCCGANGRAVIVGDVEGEPKTSIAPDGTMVRHPVRMTDARMVLQWDEKCVGLHGLAANGPKGDTLITPAVDAHEETVWQEWLAVSPAAAKEIDRWTNS